MKKIIKNILLFATIITSVFVACTVVQAENKYQDGDYTYTVEFGKATLVKYTEISLDIIVPFSTWWKAISRNREWSFL